MSSYVEVVAGVGGAGAEHGVHGGHLLDPDHQGHRGPHLGRVGQGLPVVVNQFHPTGSFKGQLISESLFDFLKFSKKPTKNLTNFCPRALKVVK